VEMNGKRNAGALRGPRIPAPGSGVDKTPWDGPGAGNNDG
jgi:hypothetical protein